MRTRPDRQKINKPDTDHGSMELFKKGSTMKGKMPPKAVMSATPKSVGKAVAKKRRMVTSGAKANYKAGGKVKCG